MKSVLVDSNVFLEPHPSVAFAEYKASDPYGNPFDISEKGWDV